MPKKKKTENKFEVVCLDTCVIYGYGLKLIREMKKQKKPSRRINLIKADGVLKKVHEKTNTRFTTILTSYEFISQIVKKEGIRLEQARRIYEQIKEEFGIIEIIPEPEEINLSPCLMNDLCKCEIDLPDGLHIYIASRRKIPFITAERKKIPNMKKFYNEVYTVEDILKHTN